MDDWLDLGMPGWDPSVHPTMGGAHEHFPISLQAALSRGNVLLGLSARDPGDGIERAISRFELPVTTDRQAVVIAVLERVRLCSTALGNGFMLPHTRRTGARLVAANTVGFARLSARVPADGISNVPVNLLFFIFACDPASHLRFLSRATRLAQEASLARALRTARQPGSVLRAVSEAERRLFAPAVVGSIRPPRKGVQPSAAEVPELPHVTALREPASWDGLRGVYAKIRHDWEIGPRPEDPTATEVARLVWAELQGASAAASPPPPAVRAERRAPGRLRDYAARVRQVVTTEQARSTATAFEPVRRSLEEAGFNRSLAWRLCLGLRRADVITGEPNRPYLGRQAQLLVDMLLADVGFRAQTMEDLEAGLMIAAEWRVALAGQRLDAEVLTEACSELARASIAALRNG